MPQRAMTSSRSPSSPAAHDRGHLVGEDSRKERKVARAVTNQIVAAYPEREIHVVLDNLSTHKPKRDVWLKRHKTVHFHYTPTHASWLSQIEKSGSRSSRQNRSPAPPLPAFPNSSPTSTRSSPTTIRPPGRSSGPNPRSTRSASNHVSPTSDFAYQAFRNQSCSSGFAFGDVLFRGVAAKDRPCQHSKSPVASGVAVGLYRRFGDSQRRIIANLEIAILRHHLMRRLFDEEAPTTDPAKAAAASMIDLTLNGRPPASLFPLTAWSLVTDPCRNCWAPVCLRSAPPSK